MFSALIIAGLAGSGMSLGAASAAEGAKPATLEEIPGSKQKRVVLTERAAERLAIETAPVREEPVKRWLIAGGMIETITSASDGTTGSIAVADAANVVPVRVRVPLSDPEEMAGRASLVLSIGGSARIKDGNDDFDLSDELGTDDEDDSSGNAATVLIVPIGGKHVTGSFRASPIEVATGADPGAKFYSIDGAAGQALQAGQRVFVRIAQPGSGRLQKVVPYSAVIYDTEGDSWVYTNPEPLVFVRQPVTIEYIEGDLAVVTDGPPLGAPVRDNRSGRVVGRRTEDRKLGGRVQRAVGRRPQEMFRWIIASSLKFRFLVIAIATAIVALGISLVRDMPVDVFPEFAPPRVEVQTEGIGMSTAEVEELITTPMEETLKGIPGLDVLRSKTVMAMSSIVLIFKRGTDLLAARQLVQERLDLAASRMPIGASPPVMLQPLSATSRVMKIGLSSTSMSMLDLSMTAYWKIRFHLLRVKGVANVAMWGERLKQLQIQVDPDRMRLHGVTLNEVIEASSDALDFGLIPNSPSAKTQTVGFIETPNQRLYIQPVSPVVTPEDLAEVPVASGSGTAVRLGDVAKVLWEQPLLIGDAVINDGPGLMLIVEKFPWANTLEVTRGVEAALDELRPGLPDIEIDHQIFRPATFIELSIHNLSMALLIGSILVTLILGAFLFEWRVALISLVAIPLSLVAAAIVFYLRGTTINTMVLAGFVVALGSIVDDAIIDVENIVRRLREHRKTGGGRSTAAIILDASLEIRSPIVYATLIIVLSVMPVFFMGGLSGAFFAPLALSYSLALLASMVVALTVTPALCLILLDKAAIEPGVAPRPMVAARLSSVAVADHSGATRGLLRLRRDGGGRHRRVAAPRAVAASLIQGARFSDALADPARHVPSRNVPGDRSCQSRIAIHSGGP